MQKNFLILFSFLGIFLQKAYCQNINLQADSLFFSKKYEEAYKLYRADFQQGAKVAPATLLKMAFVAEATQQYPEALYYLNLYHYLLPNKPTLDKLEELADKYSLKDYRQSDFLLAKLLYDRYYDFLALLLVLLNIIIFYNLLLKPLLNKRRLPLRYAWAQLTVAGLSILLLRGVPSYPRAILAQDHSLLMHAPSSGAKVLGQLPKGTRLQIHGQEDVWLKVVWEKQQGYIKSSQAYIVPTL